MKTIKYQYRYIVDGFSDKYESAYVYATGSKFNLTDDIEIEWLVNECAEDFFHQHYGYDISSWVRDGNPLVFSIFVDENTKRNYNVYVEHNPNFYSRELT